MGTIETAKNQVVVHSNDITKAAFKLSTVEHRIILSAISGVPRNEEPVTDEEIYWVSRDCLIELGCTPNNLYGQLEEAAKSLFKRYITFQDPFTGATVQLHWIQSVRLDAPYRIGIRFTKEILPFLSRVKSNFTRYELLDVSGLTSEHAYRLYGMLMRFQDTRWMEISLEDLKEQMDLGDKYPGFGQFKQRVLEVVVKQINDGCSPFRVSYYPIFTGRRVSRIRFELEEKVPPLTSNQRVFYAHKLREAKDVWEKFYKDACPCGLNLYGVNVETQVIDRIRDWLAEPGNLQMAIPYLKLVGYKTKFELQREKKRIDAEKRAENTQKKPSAVLKKTRTSVVFDDVLLNAGAGESMLLAKNARRISKES